MELTPVQSSMLKAIGYDEATQTLLVVFVTGSKFQYFDVPKDVYKELMASASKGTFMHNCIINCYNYAAE
ncbi:KTSC domain-containing protein [Aetokthonos hydrillicola Thurmond2011]|jgi:hypothetical protein|uniref:KTSC domain-containing protein n=1 Tax=Aetokthonos hydrillicola Thurmond2011 TaxID=2712845 RepID=A0AAP5I206_9CYAN|nr:KTSC domain-containing protein [Aetokthonos hydrillicola]MBO3463114.1 KTSC domain-containing protein [Aetokthonos hydrillicola CCALA 1050]MBW4591102.1 KTSC domain-containing protein [Aetokthonos hydrillicola CCALA 1050]MDR9893236.1 KTSC domain-containing protein [Aetokthonos hydrillicola Thurmond2011]